MKASELKKKSVEELNNELTGILREQFNLRMQAGGGQIAKPHLVRAGRKNIARILTVLNEKNSGGKA